MTLIRKTAWAAFALGLAALPFAADAAAPQPWQMGMQPAASPTQEKVAELHDLLLVIITAITLFVLALLAYVCWRFREEKNPTPSNTSHNTTIEVLWTVIPVLILVVIAVPSFRLLYFADRVEEADLTLKVTGFQWAWKYQYPDQGNFQFESYMIAESDLKPGQQRLLEVDNEVVVPVGKNVRVQVTGQDVIHSFYMPSLGMQKYAIPGRTLETWFRIEQPGVLYGQCNQICGVNHAFMPIAIRAVPEAEFNTWAEQAKTRFADGQPPLSIAALRERGLLVASAPQASLQ